MLKRYKGVVIIHIYNEDGKKVKEIANPKFESVFNIWVYLLIVLPGLLIILLEI